MWVSYYDLTSDTYIAVGSPCRHQTLSDDVLGTEGHVIALLVGGEGDSCLIVWLLLYIATCELLLNQYDIFQIKRLVRNDSLVTWDIIG